MGTSHHSRPDLSLRPPRPLLPLRSSQVFYLSFLIFFATLQGRRRLPENLFSMQKGAKARGKRRRPLSARPGCKTSNIFSPSKVSSSTLSVRLTLIQVPKNHLLQVLPVSPSQREPWLTSPRSTLRLESTLLLRAALATIQIMRPLTRTLSTLS